MRNNRESMDKQERGRKPDFSHVTHDRPSYAMIGDLVRHIKKEEAKTSSTDLCSRLPRTLSEQASRTTYGSLLHSPGAFRRQHLGLSVRKNKGFISKLRQAGWHSWDFVSTFDVEDAFLPYGTGGDDSDDEEEGDFGEQSPFESLKGPIQQSIGKGAIDEIANLKPISRQTSKSKKGLSVWSATITLVKSFVGSYLLYLPHMFQEAGLAFSLIILGVTAALSLFNMHLLLDCCQAKMGDTFGLVGKSAFGSWVKVAVDFSITVSQMSYCIAYFTYVAQNLQTYFPHYSLAFLMSIQLFLYIPLCSLRHLRFLSPFVLVANFCMFTGLFGVLYYFGVELFGNGPQAVRLINPSFMFIFVGSVSMSFEGTILVIPTYEAMSADAQKHFRKIITGVMLFLFIFFACFAGLGYLAYGDGVQRFITLNLPEHSPVGSIVKIGYMISIVVMFPLMMYPVSRLLERIVFGEKKVKKRTFFQKWRRLLIRSCFRSAAVVFILGAAMYLNAYYDHFNAVVGSVCVCPLALLYPAMFHIKLFSDKNSIKKNISLIATIIYGVTAIILSLAVTTITW